MKVHIVCPNPDEDKVLPRLARMLAAGTGWTLSDQPDGRADINYWMVYIDYAQRHSDWNRTLRAAYFSHYEPDTPYKRKWWKDAAARVEIKTATAAQYAAMLEGRVMRVTPPVDPEFTIKPRQRKEEGRPLVGVSGFVDPSGRKGEALLKRLAAECHDIEFVASGQGWPVRRANSTVSGLPAFYNRLDVFLCTSTIEGIPLPPLEALACGVRVVLPRGVGMLDDLPELAGIQRYEAGDYDSLKAALREAIALRVVRRGLRDAVAGYTPDAWVQSHVQGFTAALKERQTARPVEVAAPQAAPAPPRPAPERAHHGSRGVYYVAYGDPARECALGAIESFKRHMPDVPVALVSDQPLGAEDLFLECPDTDIGGRAAKVRIDELAPRDWQYILYLDADTEVTADISFLYQLVEDDWDMVICRNPGRFHTAGNMVRPDNRDECEETFQLLGTSEVLQLNGGVFAFQRNARTSAFFAKWHAEWQRYGKRDQAALLRSLWAQPLRLYVLGNEWNTITRYDAPEKTAGILHYPMTARRWRGVVHHRLDSQEARDAVRAFERERATK